MKLAMVFPGQGSQSLGMMGAYEGHAVIGDTFAEASTLLGQDLWQLAAEGPETALMQTVNTQPLMLTADVALFRAWSAAGGPLPTVVAGHSLGEYAALVAAGALAFADAVPLVRFRAEAMQQAVPEGTGAMAAVMGLDDEAIVAACAEASTGTGNEGSSEVVEPVNFNAPGQTVIAGTRAAVERAMAGCKARGAKRALLLPVSAPFHSSLLKSAADRLATRLETVSFTPPAIPVVHNVDVSTSESAAAIRSALARQAASAVRWVETIRDFRRRGVTHVIECGPGKVLTGLVRRVDSELITLPLDSSAAMTEAIDTVAHA